MRSLHARLLIAATLVLAGFLGATGAVLDRAFRDSALAAMRDRLQGHIYALLAAADVDTSGRLALPQSLPDPRFSNTESGLYAEVQGNLGAFRWRSPSMTGSGMRFVRSMDPAQREYRQFESGTGESLYAINFGVAWEDRSGKATRYTFAVAESMRPVLDQVESFRATLWAWLGGFALALLAAQAVILRWGLRPLRRVAAELREIEAGRANCIVGEHPLELRGLVENLNAVIRQGNANQKRYRESLDDLAHSMKTPLAILQAAADEPAGENEAQLKSVLREQVERMDGIVQHQLQRAVTAGRSLVAQAVLVKIVVEPLQRSLAKVYREKAVQCDIVVADKSLFYGDESDLMEILGNLMDNAYKYCRHRVRVSAAPLAEQAAVRPGLQVDIEDDGAGIDAAEARVLLRRGARKDETVPGHGIGLTVAHDIVRLYEGELEIQTSPLGGACLRIRFPSHAMRG
jgi:two-component system sensor histidine kinase PhoQ